MENIIKHLFGMFFMERHRKYTNNVAKTCVPSMYVLTITHSYIFYDVVTFAV